ncbi:uncharacterized protein K452DRAFT_293334 [Aplosporella prunicola CBS 121167]|uniref:Uncharacterized protein n=1 Tax=Aplosporella prunicola CBS 121167 TaxID=1176127 RepID=A0A6A6AWX5_9PEZI|nr:uncharacterized protein K452DRAFT_293334 [Aplosporella prunicola CBS 121167]KAF2135287.1 hypothetical protein K452DRAFT_293334 [Aplosporella prunicola CBS 121167]
MNSYQGASAQSPAGKSSKTCPPKFQSGKRWQDGNSSLETNLAIRSRSVPQKTTHKPLSTEDSSKGSPSPSPSQRRNRVGSFSSSHTYHAYQSGRERTNLYTQDEEPSSDTADEDHQSSSEEEDHSECLQNSGDDEQNSDYSDEDCQGSTREEEYSEHSQDSVDDKSLSSSSECIDYRKAAALSNLKGSKLVELETFRSIIRRLNDLELYEINMRSEGLWKSPEIMPTLSRVTSLIEMLGLGETTTAENLVEGRVWGFIRESIKACYTHEDRKKARKILLYLLRCVDGQTGIELLGENIDDEELEALKGQAFEMEMRLNDLEHAED